MVCYVDVYFCSYCNYVLTKVITELSEHGDIAQWGNTHAASNCPFELFQLNFSVINC